MPYNVDCLQHCLLDGCGQRTTFSREVCFLFPPSTNSINLYSMAIEHLDGEDRTLLFRVSGFGDAQFFSIGKKGALESQVWADMLNLNERQDQIMNEEIPCLNVLTVSGLIRVENDQFEPIASSDPTPDGCKISSQKFTIMAFMHGPYLG